MSRGRPDTLTPLEAVFWAQQVVAPFGPTQAEVARRIGCHPRTVSRALRRQLQTTPEIAALVRVDLATLAGTFGGTVSALVVARWAQERAERAATPSQQTAEVQP